MKNKTLNKSLVWKYFWQQKYEEIKKVLLALFIIWSIIGAFSQIGWINECQFIDSSTCIEGIYKTTFPIWIMISGLITTGIWIIIGLIVWIKNNWEEAKERVEEESE